MGFDRSTYAISFHIGHIGFQVKVHRILLVLQESYAVFVVRTATVFPSWLQRTLAAMLRAFIATKATLDSDGEFEGFSASDIEQASSTAIH